MRISQLFCAIFRRQQEIDLKRRNFGLTEDEIFKFYQSKNAKAAVANLKLGSTRLMHKPREELQNISLFLRLSLILENKSRAGEVRNLTLLQLENSQPDLTSQKKLCFIVNVTKSKTKESCLYLSEEKKVQLDTFTRLVTS